MAEPSPNAAAQEQEPELSLVNGTALDSEDVHMQDSTAPTEQEQEQSTTSLPEQPQQPDAPPTTQTPSQPLPQMPAVQPATPTPAPAAAPTPTPAVPSSRNSPHPTPQAPSQPVSHGSPTRVYLNTHVTPHLLDAMKHLATAEPEKPLKWLSEYLAAKSVEVEGV